MKGITCLRSAEGSVPAWLDALDRVNIVCHRWWPNGFFVGRDDGIPVVSDVDLLRAQLVDLVEGLQLTPPPPPPPTIAHSPDTPQELLQDDGGRTRTPRPDRPVTPPRVSVFGQWASLAAGAHTAEPPSASPAATPTSMVAQTPRRTEAEPQSTSHATDPAPTAPEAHATASTSAPSASTSIPTAPDPPARPQFSPWDNEMLKSLGQREASRFDPVGAEEMNNYLSDHRPQAHAAASLVVNRIAQECRAEASSHSRLVVTAPREVFKDGKRIKFEGHVSLQDRIFTNNLPRMPTYTPAVGDDMNLFMRILLTFLPLDRIRHVWKPSIQAYDLPNNAQIMKFHREFAPKLAAMMDKRFELWRWRLVFIEFLNKKIPRDGPNEFKWDGFWMTEAEIEIAVTETTYHYGMQRMGYD